MPGKGRHYLQFQSTPPAEARGDHSINHANVCVLELVSIHSPRRSEGRLPYSASDSGWLHGVSIHSPRRSEGRQLGQVCAERCD